MSLTDFVEATRGIFQEHLEEAGLGQGPFMFSYHEAASLMDTSAFHSPVSIRCQNRIRFINVVIAKITDVGDVCQNELDVLTSVFSSDVRVGVQLQQRGHGAVPDGTEAAAEPDERAEGQSRPRHHCSVPKTHEIK